MLIATDYEKFQQGGSALTFIIFIIFGEAICIISFITLTMCCGWMGKIFCLIYSIYFVMDRAAAVDGRRRQGSTLVRNSSFWRHFTGYFPIRLVRTAELKPTRHFLIALFPHGIFSLGAFGNFASNATGFSNLFPGIRSRMCTMNYHFNVPFFRDVLLSCGMASVSRESIINLLNDDIDECHANAAVVVVGGYREIQKAEPHVYRFHLKNRKGFVKLALETGASLVPAISFGEVDVVERSTHKFLIKFFSLFGMPNIKSLMPLRRPITTVVGSPIDVIRSRNPTANEIDELHGRFCEELLKLFNEHKLNYCEKHENARVVVE